MFAFVHRLRRQGQLIPRHQLSHQPGPIGLFTLKEERDRETMRTLRIARLTDREGSSTELLPPLLDAMVIYASPSSWTVTGWEREDTADLYARAFQQSWWLSPLSPRQVLEYTDGARIKALLNAS